MIVPKVIMLAAALGAVLLLGSAPTALAAEHKTPVARCGGKANADSTALQQPLPNAYMTTNDRVFSLADLVACAKRLHAARFS